MVTRVGVWGGVIDEGLCAGPCNARGWGAGGGVVMDGFRVSVLLFCGERKGDCWGDGDVKGGDVKDPTGAGEVNGEGLGDTEGGDVAGCPLGSLVVSLSSSSGSLV